MPDNTTSKDKKQEVLPDYNLLRKPLSKLSKDLKSLNKTVVKVTKSLTGITKIDLDKLETPLNNNVDSRVPATAPEDYPALSKTPISSPVISTIQSQTSSPQVEPVKPADNGDKQSNNVIDTKKSPPNSEKSPAKPPTFISKVTEKLRDTLENVTSKETVSKDSFLYKTMERVGDSVATVKDKLKNQPKINKILESSSSTLNTIKEKLKDQPVINKALEKSSTALDNIKNNLKEQPKKLAESAIKFGKEGWQEQKEMDTPLMKVISGVKELGKGNITGAAKQVMSAKSAYNETQKPDKDKTKPTETKQTPVNSISNQTSTTNSSTTNDNSSVTNITGIQQFNEKLDESKSEAKRS